MQKEEDRAIDGFVDVFDYFYHWRYLFVAVILASLLASFLALNTFTTHAHVTARVSIYPAIPGANIETVTAGLQRSLRQELPNIGESSAGFDINVNPDRAEQTIALLGKKIDAFEQDLRGRIDGARFKAEEEYRNNPSNPAVFTAKEQYAMFPAGIDLISHTEGQSMTTKPTMVVVVSFLTCGLLFGAFISLVVSTFREWVKRDRSREFNSPI